MKFDMAHEFFQWLPLIFNDFSRQNAIFPGQHKIQWLFKLRVKFHDFSRPVRTMQDAQGPSRPKKRRAQSEPSRQGQDDDDRPRPGTSHGSRSGNGGPTVGKSWGKYKIPKICIKGFTDTEESDVSSTESYYRESDSSESDVDDDDPNEILNVYILTNFNDWYLKHILWNCP